MTLKLFAAWILSRWSAKPRTEDLAIMALGLCGEAGEVVEHIKKQIRGSKPVDTHEIALELGDVLHYWCCICNHFNLDPELVMKMNIEKLNRRANLKEIFTAPNPPDGTVKYDEYARALK